MTSGLVLSLFPGIGLLDMAFEEEGFCVVRGPDLLWGGDIHRFHPPAGKFDGVIGGPPCQAFSRLRHIVKANGYQTAPNLIPEFERCIREARPMWFVMENVPDAPIPVAGSDYYVTSDLIRDVWVGGVTNRLRRFSFGRLNGSSFAMRLPIEVRALYGYDVARAVTCDARQVPVAIGGSGKRKGLGGALPRSGKTESIAQMLEFQGLPADFFSDLPLTMTGKKQLVGNGVPLPMGRAIARAVKQVLTGRVA